MRDIPQELIARIESGAATLCHAWVLSRADGAVMGFTDHDRNLEVDGMLCLAASGWTAGAAEVGTDGICGSLAVAGGLDAEAIREEDLDAGLYDGAEVVLWRVDWRRPDLKVRLQKARLARVRREGGGFIAELEGPLAALERVVGRTCGRDCDATLGDSRCRVDLSAYPGMSCDRRWRTCTSVFCNGANFQGFPDVPGDDFLTATPVEGGPNDGGSRR